MSKPNRDSKFYFTGTGLGSLTGTAFLLRDCGFKGENIYILKAIVRLLAGAAIKDLPMTIQYPANYSKIQRDLRMLKSSLVMLK